MNREAAKAAGLEGFEHAKFEPVGLTDGAGEVHELTFRTNIFGPGVAVDAFELRAGSPAGYHFQIIGDPADDLLVMLGCNRARFSPSSEVAFLELSSAGWTETCVKDDLGAAKGRA